MRKHLAAGLMLSLILIIIMTDMEDNGTGSDELKGFDDAVIVEFPLRREQGNPLIRQIH